MNRNTPVRGFTLIELLVVVAIIGALIAILVPSLSNVRRRASLVACGVNLRTLSQLDNQYAGENNGFIPRDSGGGIPSIPFLFARMQKIQLIASGPVGAFESQYFEAYKKLKWLQCPAFPNPEMPYDYVTNGFDPANPRPTGGAGTYQYIEVRRIHRPSELINFTEANANFTPGTDLNEVWHEDQLNENKTAAPTGGSTVGRIARNDKRHGGPINIAYFDTHVEPKDSNKSIKLADFIKR